jgi:hypothetical protein
VPSHGMAGVMGRSISRPLPIGISFTFAMGSPRGNGLSLWIHLARVLDGPGCG